MRKDPFSKLQSSLSLEDLLAQPNTRNTPNWLITYLDVFVLIVMLVITLITLNDIKIDQQQITTNTPKKTPVIKCPAISIPKVIVCPTPVITENKPIEVTENKVTFSPDSPNISAKLPENNKGVPAPVTSQEAKLAADTSISSSTTLLPIEENKLQQQLTKTLMEFGLNKAVNIKINQGYAQLEIQDNVLFKSSDAMLTTSGEALLKRLIPLLKQAVGLILIEGHTDNIPIKTPQFRSNWELGSARATSVLHFLVSQQLDSNHLRAMTYADTMPIADNSTPAGREKNRRVNLLIKFSAQ
jgi:chemotaxis protein MotB